MMRHPGAAVAAVLVNYNGAEDTLDSLASLDRVERPGGVLRLLVVDNGSTDGSAGLLRRRRPGVEVLETGTNLGFAGGNEVGIRHVLRDPGVGWVLLLNTDVEVARGFLPPLLEACRDPSVGAAGPKIFYFEPRDRLWAAGGRLRLRETVTEEWGRGEPDGPRWSRPQDVTYLTTCCLLVPRDAFERVGLLDPLFFLNVDDADWCRRAAAAGFRLRYVPESRVWHKVAASTGGGYTPLKTFHTGRSNALYVRRHYGWGGLVVFLLANLAALAAAFVRELPRRNTGAVWSKARGIWSGLRAPMRQPPTL